MPRRANAEQTFVRALCVLRTINPGVDLGQVEGAFVFGMGLVLSEHVEADPTTGACITDSTWSYKVPGPLCVPHKLNVAMLKDSPLFFKVRCTGWRRS